MKKEFIFAVLIANLICTNVNANDYVYQELKSLSSTEMVVILGALVCCGLRKLIKPENINRIDYVKLGNRFCERNPLGKNHANLDYAMRYFSDNE